MVARWGFGCEPASAASVAGLRRLLDEQVISPIGIGRLHPDRPRAEGPERHGEVSHRHRHESRPGPAPRAEPHGKLSNRPVPVEDDLEASSRAMGGEAAGWKSRQDRSQAPDLPIASIDAASGLTTGDDSMAQRYDLNRDHRSGGPDGVAAGGAGQAERRFRDRRRDRAARTSEPVAGRRRGRRASARSACRSRLTFARRRRC